MYVPKCPNQDFEENGHGFSNPSERGIKVRDVWIKSEDGTQLHGWHMCANDFDVPKDTIVFMHENTGNLG